MGIVVATPKGPKLQICGEWVVAGAGVELSPAGFDDHVHQKSIIRNSTTRTAAVRAYLLSFHVRAQRSYFGFGDGIVSRKLRGNG